MYVTLGPFFLLTRPIDGASSTGSDGMVPLYTWITEQDFDLHFRNSLPTDLLAIDNTLSLSHYPQETGSTPSLPSEHPADSLPVSKGILGVSQPSSCMLVSFIGKFFLPDIITAINGRCAVGLHGVKASPIDR